MHFVEWKLLYCDEIFTEVCSQGFRWYALLIKGDPIHCACMSTGLNALSNNYTPRFNEVERGYTGFTMSVCPSVHLWTESCPLCIFKNTCPIHFIFAHLIKQLQKVCHISSLFRNSKILNFDICLLLTWDPTWLSSMGNHGAAGVSSKRRRSSCSSLDCFADCFVWNIHLWIWSRSKTLV